MYSKLFFIKQKNGEGNDLIDSITSYNFVVLSAVMFFLGFALKDNEHYRLAFMLLFTLWFVLCCIYSIKKNKYFFIKFSFLELAFIVGTLIRAFINDSYIFLLYQFAISSMLIVFGIFVALQRQVAFKEEKLEVPFRAQVADINRLESMIERYEMVCVDALWGSGKTFITEHFKDRNKGKYYFVTVQTVSYSLDEVPYLIMDELCALLTKNRIFPQNLYSLRRIIAKNEKLSFLSFLFPTSNKTLGDLMKSYTSNLSQLDKPIVVFFEDIDRVLNFEDLAKILSISEMLTNPKYGEKIKVVFECDYELMHSFVDRQYNNSCMEEANCGSDYLEKYMAQRMSLTPMTLAYIMNSLLQDDLNKNDGKKNYPNIGEGDLEAINNLDAIYNLYNGYILNDYIEIQNRVVPIRTVVDCMREINLFLADPIWRERRLVNIVVMMCILQHIDENIYSEIHNSDNLFECLTEGI